MKPTDKETQRYYHSFTVWLKAFHPLEALKANFNGVDRESFTLLIREWAQTITKGSK